MSALSEKKTRALQLVETTERDENTFVRYVDVRCDRCRFWKLVPEGNEGKCERLSDSGRTEACYAHNTCCGCSRYDMMTEPGFGCALFENSGETPETSAYAERYRNGVDSGIDDREKEDSERPAEEEDPKR